MKVLFAVSSESISDAIVKRYQKEYKEIISHKNVYYFNAILKEIQKDKTYDRIVISEDLESFSNNNYDQIDKFIFEKLDDISDEAQDIDGNETSIILICSDRQQKGNSFLVKLFSIGVYNALLGSERSMDQVCKLINKPRNKKEAKMYYKMDADEANYGDKGSDEVSEMEIQSILSFFKKTSKDKYAESFNNIAAQYTEEQLKIIINCLPTGVKVVLEDDCKKYQELVTVNGMVQRVNREGVVNQEARRQTGIKIDIIDNKLNQTKMSGPIVIPASVRTSKNQGPAPVRPMGNSLEVPETSKTEPTKVKKVVKRSELEARKIQNPVDANRVAPTNSEAKTTRPVAQRPVENVATKSQVPPVAPTKRVRTAAEVVQIPPVAGNIKIKKESLANETDEKKGRGRPKKAPVATPSKTSLVDEEDDFMLPGMFDVEDDELILPKKEEKTEIEEDMLPGMEAFEDEELPSMDDVSEDDMELPGMEAFEEDEELPGMDAFEEDEELPGMDVLEEDEELPGMDALEEDEELPGMDAFEEDEELPGMDAFEEDEELPGMDTLEEDEELPEMEEFEEDEELPGMEVFEDDEDDTLPGMLDDFEGLEDDTIPVMEDEEYTEEVALPGIDELDDFEDSSVQEDANIDEILPGMDDDFDDGTDDLLSGFDDDFSAPQATASNAQSSSQIESIKPKVDYSMSSLNSLLTKDKKIVAFVGTSKNGTSFLVNNLAALFSLSGINTAILDMTKNKNSYYIYTNNEEELRNIAYNSISKLQNGGFAEGIKVNKSLSVYTALPNDGKDYSNAEPILSTLVQNHSLILIDCDFDTDPSYFASCQEIYLVQSMDILTIQPLTSFVRDLKVIHKVLSDEKVRIVINKELKVKSLTERVIINGMSFYNDPSMSFMTELFNKDTVKACTIPFDENVYSRYLDGIVNCKVSINGYEKNKKFWEKFKTLGDMVYPLVSKSTYGGKNTQVNQINYGKSNFSNNMNSTLDQMKKKY